MDNWLFQFKSLIYIIDNIYVIYIYLLILLIKGILGCIIKFQEQLSKQK